MDNSILPAQADSLDQRLHAEADRSTEGFLKLLRELSRIGAAIESGSISPLRTVKRFQFYGYELQARLLEAEPTASARLNELNRFLFVDHGFRCLLEPKGATSAGSLLLQTVLENRLASPLVLSLIYAYLAEGIGVRLEFVDLHPTCFLRWTEAGHSRFIDVSRGGATLSSEDLIALLQKRVQVHQRARLLDQCLSPTPSALPLAETIQFDEIVSDYLLELRSLLQPVLDAERALILQNALVSYQPSNLHFVAERAKIHRRLGNFKSALADLKRYFAFHDRARAPQEYVLLQNELIELLARSTS